MDDSWTNFEKGSKNFFIMYEEIKAYNRLTNNYKKLFFFHFFLIVTSIFFVYIRDAINLAAGSLKKCFILFKF